MFTYIYTRSINGPLLEILEYSFNAITETWLLTYVRQFFYFTE